MYQFSKNIFTNKPVLFVVFSCSTLAVPHFATLNLAKNGALAALGVGWVGGLVDQQIMEEGMALPLHGSARLVVYL